MENMKENILKYMSRWMICFLLFMFPVLGARAEEKNHPENYWSKTNAPIFYGAAEITIKKGSITEFDAKDARFRVFAKDFEDGDLTQKITVQGQAAVDITQVGTYSVSYQVTDSHGNMTELKVPISVVDESNLPEGMTEDIKVVRTLYTLPSMWNLDNTDMKRCNYGDRQILGVYLPAGQKIKARIIQADNDILVATMTNDRQKDDASQKLLQDKTLLEIENKNQVSSVPFFTSTVLSKEKTDLQKTFQVELQYSAALPAVDYYHYQDNETEFRSDWKASKNDYAVLENEVMTLLVPFADIDKMTGYYKNSFDTLDAFLAYYQKVIEKMDEYVGLEWNPKVLSNQNVRAKYLVKAGANGVGAAYYAGNYIAVNNSSLAPFFEVNWGGLHELAHGYQGHFGKGNLMLGEVGNNILGHYIQIDKSIYESNNNWLGEYSQIEEAQNQIRQEGLEFANLEVNTKLYALVNLFNMFEGPKTYAKMNQWFRQACAEGKIADKSANNDTFCQALKEVAGVNVIPYMEAWGITVSPSVKEEIYQENLPAISILKDMVDEDTLAKIQTDENISLKYQPVLNNVFQNYNIKGEVELSFEIDDFSLLQGQKIQVKDADKVIKELSIDKQTIVIKDLPVGTYTIAVPKLSSYVSKDSLHIAVKQNKKTEYHYEYLNLQYQSDIKFIIKGIFGNSGCEIEFLDKFQKLTIDVNAANMTNGNNWKIAVRIFDEKEQCVREETLGADGKHFANHASEDYANNKKIEIPLKKGYFMELVHTDFANKIQVTDELTGNDIADYLPNEETTIYTVTEKGLVKGRVIFEDNKADEEDNNKDNEVSEDDKDNLNKDDDSNKDNEAGEDDKDNLNKDDENKKDDSSKKENVKQENSKNHGGSSQQVQEEPQVAEASPYTAPKKEISQITWSKLDTWNKQDIAEEEKTDSSFLDSADAVIDFENEKEKAEVFESDAEAFLENEHTFDKEPFKTFLLGIVGCCLGALGIAFSLMKIGIGRKGEKK